MNAKAILSVETHPVSHPEFKKLTQLLDEELHDRYGLWQSDYDPDFRVEDLNTLVLSNEEDVFTGCGAMRQFSPGKEEVVRLFVKPEFRRMGIGTAIMKKLESEALERGANSIIVETGVMQPESLALYQLNGYRRIPLFRERSNPSQSICLEKVLK